jgi:hypothetical protein
MVAASKAERTVPVPRSDTHAVEGVDRAVGTELVVAVVAGFTSTSVG